MGQTKGVGQPVWGNRDNEVIDESITVPNGRLIYALIVSGYSQNRFLDELMVCNFARHLMALNAYVHYAWWNNLLASYMERPLHHPQSHPDNLEDDITNFRTPEEAAIKAFPGEDYQFVADPTRFLSAIRQNNPERSSSSLVTAWAAAPSCIWSEIQTPPSVFWRPLILWEIATIPGPGRTAQDDFNWTRWRITRDNFLGYKSATRTSLPLKCEPTGRAQGHIGSISRRFLRHLF